MPHKPGRLILETVALRDHMVRLEREDGLPRIVIRALRRRRRARHRLRRGGLFARHVGRLRVRHDDAALHLFVDDDAGAGLRLRHGDARAHAAQDAGGAVRPRPGRLRHAAHPGARAPTARLVPVSLLYRKDTPLDGSAPLLPLRLRRLRHRHPGQLLDHAPVAGRPRLRLRHRPHPRRQGQGLSLVHATASCKKKVNTFTDFIAAGEHLVQARLHQPRPHRRQRRLGRRHADGRGRQHGARPVRSASSPTCRSSTCSTPCSTTPCR